MTQTTQRPASDKQIAFIERLMSEKDLEGTWSTSGMVQTWRDMLDNGTLTGPEASQIIESLLSAPRKPNPQDATPGVYRKDGAIFVVKPNRDKTAFYAKKLVEIGGERLTESDDVVNFEMVYAPGIVRTLTQADRMPLADATALMTRYGRCINCGRHLKAAKSVAAGIGPVCAQAFG